MSIKNRFVVVASLFSLTTTLFAADASACHGHSNMHSEVSEGGWEVVWSPSYGYVENIGILTACTFLGCAQSYLGAKLDELVQKMGQNAVELALKNHGSIFDATKDGRPVHIKAGIGTWALFIVSSITERMFS